MKISYNWLKDYLSTDLSAEEVSRKLTACGLEVESLEKRDSVPGGFEGVVIGQVISCVTHPNADRLTLTRVDVGEGEPLQIVCGAPNVAAGQKVVVAKLGAKVRIGDGEVEMKKTKIRGELSEGMICAEDELGLGTSHAGIMVLPDDTKTGTSARDYFNIKTDYVFEIGLTPNRSDAASHLGVARDLAAVLRNEAYLTNNKLPELLRPNVSEFRQDDNACPMEVLVEDTDACPRYSGLSMTGLVVGESPGWLRERLESIGLRPINNLVDISNYVMMETGQPLHFFDAEKIGGSKVIIRKLPDQTPFTTLDNIERKLSQDDLMICDTDGGMCIAGVFGGTRSGVTADTTSIFIESATFNAVSIRKTSRRHGLKTDASFRFERGSDPEITVYALKRAVQLIRELCGGRVSSAIYDVYPRPVAPVRMNLRMHTVDTLIGKRLDRDHLAFILESLDIRVLNRNEEAFAIEVPAYRVDVTREVDVIEEILRIYGYNNVEVPERLFSSLAYGRHPDSDKLRNRISDMLTGQGFDEAMCNSLSNSEYYTWQERWKPEHCVPILNPVSQDLDVMRQTLVFGGLETIRYNRNRRLNDIRIFEFGNIYSTNGKKPVAEDTLAPYTEERALLLMISGSRNPEAWNTTAGPSDYFELKSALENIIQKLGVSRYSYSNANIPVLSEGMELNVNGTPAGWLGELDKSLLKRFDIDAPVYVAEINWNAFLKANTSFSMQFSPIPRFPEVRRDLALVVGQDVTFQALSERALRAEPGLLRAVNLFDVYEGKGIETGKKSYALSFILQDEDKTLTDKVIEKAMARIQKALEDEFGAMLR